MRLGAGSAKQSRHGRATAAPPPQQGRGELRGHCSDLRVGAPVSARETESLRPTLLIFNDIAHTHPTYNTCCYAFMTDIKSYSTATILSKRMFKESHLLP